MDLTWSKKSKGCIEVIEHRAICGRHHAWVLTIGGDFGEFRAGPALSFEVTVLGAVLNIDQRVKNRGRTVLMSTRWDGQTLNP